MPNRIRYVKYYCREDLPSAMAQGALLGRFLREHIGTDRTLGSQPVRQFLGERAFAAFSGRSDKLADADVAAIEALFARDGLPLVKVKAATLVVDASLATMRSHIQKFAPLQRDGFLTRWKVVDALLPMTSTSLADLIKVRKCWCDCWVRVGARQCPFCGWEEPGGRATSAWERLQFQGQPLNQPNGPVLIAPTGNLTELMRVALTFGFQVTSNTEVLGDSDLEVDQPALDDEFLPRDWIH